MQSSVSSAIFTTSTVLCVIIAATMLPVQQADAGNLDLLILHNNDMHSRFAPTSADSGTCKDPGKMKCYGGFARTAHVVKTHRSAEQKGVGRPVLYLNAGDTYQGSTYFTVHRERIVIDFLNALMPNVTSFGNHEFDLGIESVLTLLREAEFPIVAANLNYSREPAMAAMHIQKSAVLSVEGHLIGVIGYLTAETKEISSPGKLIFEDEVESIRRESERLDAQGIKIIVALGHSGFNKDKQIAEQVPLVDLVIGGHTNTFLWNGKKPDLEEVEGLYPTEIRQPSGKKVPVVQAYAYTKYMGRLNVTFDDNGDLLHYEGSPLLLDSSIPENPEIKALVQKYAAEIEKLNKIIIGNSRVKLDTTTHNCRFKECNFGNLIADAFVAYHAYRHGGHYWTDAPIGLTNGGSIRSNVDNVHFGGNVSRGDLLGAMPFGSQVVSMDLSGSVLLSALEHAVWMGGETSHGEFLQMSGLHVVYDLSRPQGQRVVEAKARCARCEIPVYEPVDPNADYRVIMNSFIADGGDRFKMFQNLGKNRSADDLLDLDVVAWYLNKMSPSAPEISGRIVVIPNESSSASARLESLNSFLVVVFVLLRLNL